MAYQVLKVYNNNVILASQQNKEVVLVSKGIGFGKKPGDFLDDTHPIEKVFHEPYTEHSIHQIQQVTSDEQALQFVLKGIMKIAEDKLGPLKPNTEMHIKDHIEFAIYRLKIGLEIENPFLDEIKALYQSEYKLAGIVRELIDKRLKIDIGDEEQGFIALHLYAAKTQRSVNEAMRLTHLYQKCIQVIKQHCQVNIEVDDIITKQFFNSLKLQLKYNKKGVLLTLKIRPYVEAHLKKSYGAAVEIANYIKEQKNIVLNESEISYLALEIEKLTQYANQIKGHINQK